MADRVHLVADFNAESLARLLANSVLVGADVTTSPYGQVYQTLSAPPEPDWSVVIWTQPAAVVEHFRRALDFEPVDLERALDEVRAYAEAIRRFAAGVRNVFVPTWTLPPFERGYGMLDFRSGVGLAHLLARMNLTLAEALRDDPSVFVLDAQRWMNAAGARAVSPKLWYASKTPFSPTVFEHAAADIAAALAGLRGAARRLVILDLDNLLWDGVVGELGWEGLNLGGHDFVGEAFADFQRALKGLTRRGIQLAVVSKNDEAVALEAIDRHPEMQLRRADLAGWRINWLDKAQNIVELLADLKLGAESAVFIDDSAIERGRVREAVPGILVPDWPEDPTRFRETLNSLRCFDTPFLTNEDRARSGMYAAERDRQATFAAATSLEEWLSSLNLTIGVETLTPPSLERAAQLLNKTNQMNLSTRRLTAVELEAWADDPRHTLLTFRVADRFGDYGLTAIVGLTFADRVGHLTDYLLSCRVMGRRVEETMLHVAVARCRAQGARQLIADFRSTPRNAPCLDFLRRSGLREIETHRFVWDAAVPYERPRSVALHDGSDLVTPADR